MWKTSISTRTIFVARVNSDLIGKYVNIASRASKFITEYFDGKLAFASNEQAVIDDLQVVSLGIGEALNAREFGKAIRDIMVAADRINEAFDMAKPWVLAKDPAKRAELQNVCSVVLYGFKLLTVYLTPILPALSKRVAIEILRQQAGFSWADAAILPTRINPYSHLMQRVDPKQSTRCSTSPPPQNPLKPNRRKPP